MVNTKAVRQAIYERLNTAAVTGLLANGSASIFHAVAPPTGNFPLLIFSKQSGTMVDRSGGDAFKDGLWLVKGVARAASSSAAEDIDKAAHDRLQFHKLSITGADTMFLARQSDVEYTETSGDTQFRHVGGLYRLVTQDS